MSNNSSLHNAKEQKNDEFYTQFNDIQHELNNYYEFNPDFLKGKTVLCPCDDPSWSNFTKFFLMNAKRYGLKKVISTSYAPNAKKAKGVVVPALWGQDVIWEKKDGYLNCSEDFDRLNFDYLKGDGDFRSDEVKALRDEADVIITNPPFSLFREFISWIFEKDPNKEFLVIGNMNAITYKEIFPLIKENKVWVGATGFVSRGYYNPETKEIQKFGNTCWFTNLDHGVRHEFLQLNKFDENLYVNKKIKAMGGYQKYDNYDAIEIPEVKAIPSDYKGVMGVPISFMDKYNPEQFEIVGLFNHGKDNIYDIAVPKINNKLLFKRIAIKLI